MIFSSRLWVQKKGLYTPQRKEYTAAGRLSMKFRTICIMDPIFSY